MMARCCKCGRKLGFFFDYGTRKSPLCGDCASGSADGGVRDAKGWTIGFPLRALILFVPLIVISAYGLSNPWLFGMFPVGLLGFFGGIRSNDSQWWVVPIIAGAVLLIPITVGAIRSKRPGKFITPFLFADVVMLVGFLGMIAGRLDNRGYFVLIPLWAIYLLFIVELLRSGRVIKFIMILAALAMLIVMNFIGCESFIRTM
jgi:hypothetical protein